MGGGRMAKKKLGHPAWFKLFYGQRTVFEAVDDAAVGRAVKAALSYLESGEQPKLDPLASVVFASLCRDVEAAWGDYRLKSDAGTKGNKGRWGKASECDTERYPVSTSDTQYHSGSQGIKKLEASYRKASAAPGFEAGEQYGIDPDYELFVKQEGNK